MITKSTAVQLRPVQLDREERRLLLLAFKPIPLEDVEVEVTTVSGTVESIEEGYGLHGYRYVYTVDGVTIRLSEPLYKSGAYLMGDGSTLDTEYMPVKVGDEVAVQVQESSDGDVDYTA